jgi:NADPH:quinone reductase-like Zn-dependent oxidoreductase
MGGSAVTAWACLFGHTPCLVPGSTVLILGTGGVSIFAAQFALMSGSSIILCSSSDDKIAKAKEILQPLLNPTAGKDAIRSINYSVDTEWDKVGVA